MDVERNLLYHTHTFSKSDLLLLRVHVHSPVREIDGKHTARLGVAGDGRYLPTFLHEEYSNGHIKVGVTGLLVVVEYTDTIPSST